MDEEWGRCIVRECCRKERMSEVIFNLVADSSSEAAKKLKYINLAINNTFISHYLIPTSGSSAETKQFDVFNCRSDLLLMNVRQVIARLEFLETFDGLFICIFTEFVV